MNQDQRRIVALIIVSAGVIGLAFAPLTREIALAWWIIGLSGFILATVLACVRARRRGSLGRTVPLSVVGFIVAAAGGVALTGVVVPSSAGAVPAVAADRPAEALSAVAVLAGRLQPLDGTAAGGLVAAARANGYTPQSGLTPDWDAARAFAYGSATVVSVPLLGTDVPEMTKVAFTTVGGRTTVTEMAAGMVSASAVHYAQWQDGALTQNVDLEKGQSVPKASAIGTRGLDWNRLNTCLNNIGISWAVIAVLGVACGAACATAVLCAPCLAAAAGFTTGSIAKCVSVAWA